MRTCPQCNSNFTEEYFFCLNDGVRLLDDAGEQLTYIAPAVSRRPCPNCGASNERDAVYCSKCGRGVAGRESAAVSVATVPRTPPLPGEAAVPASTPLPTFLTDAQGHEETSADTGFQMPYLVTLLVIAILGIFLIIWIIENS